MSQKAELWYNTREIHEGNIYRITYKESQERNRMVQNRSLEIERGEEED
jgi:hypothetical protein